MKTKWVVCLTAVLVLAVSGCGKEPEREGKEQAEAELTVYSLYENDFLQGMIRMFNGRQTKIHVDYVYDITAENGVSEEEAAARLDEKMAEGKGPDVLLLDGLEQEAYLENERLHDLSGLLDEKEHYTNIALPMTREKKVYGIPLSFSLMAVHGEEKLAAASGTFENLAGYLEAYHKAHPERLTLDQWETSNYMDVIFKAYFPELLEDGYLEREEVEAFYINMEKMHRASKDNWTVNGIETGEIVLDYLKLDSNWWQEGLLAMGEVDASISGVIQCTDVERLYHYGKVRKGLAYEYFKRNGETIFIPGDIIAVMEDGRHKEGAEEFVSYCISYKAMREEGNGLQGFPINRRALQEPFRAGLDDTDIMENSKGEEIALPFKDLPEKEQEAFFAMIDSLKEYSYVDQTIEKLVMKQAENYINKKDSLEESAKMAAEAVNSYLQSEKKKRV